MKSYNSKGEIYDDYEIAVKFRLKYDVFRDFYDRFFEALRAKDNWRITEFNREVAAGAYLVTKVADKSKEAIVKKAMSAIKGAIRNRWPAVAIRKVGRRVFPCE